MGTNIETTIGRTFMMIADGLEKGTLGPKPKIALTGMGGEHGEENSLAAALMAAKEDIDVYYIGTAVHEGVTTIPVTDDEAGHKKMEEMLEARQIDGAVTMHFPFPIGVSTVGRVITPAKGKEMFIATTTGTSSTDRVDGMIRNAVYGIITAKACGFKKPTVGILNVDGARQTEKSLKELAEKGYELHFAESSRADGGCILRGNDVLQGAADVLVTDPLTGNILVKMLSSYTTGGSFEYLGYGYGPGIGEAYEKLVLIVSRASGAPLIAGAVRYAAELVRGNIFAVSREEFAAVKKAGFNTVLETYKTRVKASLEDVAVPPAEVVTAQIFGIEIMDLEEAVKALWKKEIYAESGMGCTGPVIRVSEVKLAEAQTVLRAAGYID